MYFFKALLLVALLVNDVAAQSPLMWLPKNAPTTAPAPMQPPQIANTFPGWQQANLPVKQALVDACQVEEGERIRCGLQDITAAQCDAINCCFDGQQCYYGQSVTVQCTRDGQIVVVVARDATLPPLDVQSVTLEDSTGASCDPVGTTSAFAIYQFPVTACGTTMTEEDGFVVYNNYMSSSYEIGIGPRGSITRDSHFELQFQCRYSAISEEALVFDVKTLSPPMPVAALGPLRVELRLANGQCLNKGCVEEEEAYKSYYTESDYPVTKMLKEPVYVEVHIQERSDPDIVLNLERCWATANPIATTLPQWDLLVDGCPYQDDSYLTTVLPVSESSGVTFPSHYKRFLVKMFAFVAEGTFTPQKERVFLHCATAVCSPSPTDSCQQPCHRRKRATAVKRVSPSEMIVVSSGEVLFSAERARLPKTVGKRFRTV